MTPGRRYAAWFEGLERDALDGLAGVVTDDVRFRDPFNDVRGVEAMRRVLDHMFATCDEARFTVDEVVAEGDVAYLRWTFHCRPKGRRTPLQPITGVSRVVFAADGRASEHVDYWDAAGELYEQVPLLGALMRALRRRLAV